MKKHFFWMMAAILVCGAVMFTSCSKDDDDEKTTESPLTEKLLGKWMQAENNGELMLTNKKSVTTFYSSTRATVSTSRETRNDRKVWSDAEEYEVKIDGDHVTLTCKQSETTTLVNEYIIKEITENEMICEFRHLTIHDGEVPERPMRTARFVKQPTGLDAKVLGLWECTGLSGIETYNDANARLEFFADGTYKYWRKNDFNVWNAVTSREFQDYFVDGTLLATRWKDEGDAELREWWEIESISGDEMVWKALRQNEDGTTSTQRMTWKKI